MKNERSIPIQINKVLEEENSGYRMIGELFVPITNQTELSSVKEVLFSSFESVEMRMKKALELYSNRLHPDYENSIKESINAVESYVVSSQENLGNQQR